MSNRYLEKIAEDVDDRYLGAWEGIGGAAALKVSPRLLLGYDTLYHGTTKNNADSIRRHGFDVGLGGSNNASSNAKYSELSKGKSHFTKHYIMAKMYSNQMDLPKKDRSIGGGEVLKVRVPHRLYKHFENDITQSFSKSENAKDIASKTSRRVGPEYVSGGVGSKGIMGFINGRHLGAYYGGVDGRLRATKGLGYTLLGAALLGDGARRVHAHYNNKDDDAKNN